MSHDEQHDAPPTEPGDIEDSLLDEPPLWPKVVGITSIVWASIGLTCTGCGALGPAVFFPMIQGAANAQGPLPPSMQFGILQWITLVTGGLIATLLLVAGIMLVNRRPAARGLHLVYALVSMVQGVVGIFIQLQVHNQMKAWAQQNPTSPFAQGQNTTGLIIGLAIGVVLGLGWPLFCLIWFGLVKKTPESMTGGYEQAA